MAALQFELLLREHGFLEKGYSGGVGLEMATSGYRRDPILEDLLAIENFSQALKHVNRKLKKTPKSLDLLVPKAQVLQRMGDSKAAFEQCEEFVKITHPVTDTDHLYQIHETLWYIGRYSDLESGCAEISTNLWKRAVQAQMTASGRARIAKEWAQTATAFSQWAQVQQVRFDGSG